MHTVFVRIPGFRTELGFGLHVGWAIEGAIGTSEKVDPSYLSPHIELSMRLEVNFHNIHPY